jgi:glycosyl hydrolase family 2
MIAFNLHKGVSMQQWQNELADVVSLDGQWTFSLRDERGTIRVPGTWEAQGFARQADGPAIYQRTIRVPAEWQDKCIQLQFDAVSYEAKISVNGAQVGQHTGMWSPFALDVTDAVRCGEDNEISLTIFKPGERFPMRESLAGFLPDVATTFGGIWQSARLVAFESAALSDLSIKADPDSGSVAIQANTHEAENFQARVTIYTPDGRPAAEHIAPAGEPLNAILSLTPLRFWRPDQPTLYTLQITLQDGQRTAARIRRTFGFRQLTSEGDQLLLNDVPICLRGVLNWGWYPEILCPAPDEAAIRDEFRRVRELGFNMVKLCLYVPSARYFEIADEEGMMLWLELPMWLPKVTERLRHQAPLEYAEILSAVQHHPSIAIYSLGCELNQSVDETLMGELNEIVRGQTFGAMICDNSGSGEAYGGLAFDFADFNDYHFYADLQYFDPLVDHFSRDWRGTRPWIFGEFCDADDYRDLDEIEAAYGGKLPWWLTERNPLHPLTFIAYPEQRLRMQSVVGAWRAMPLPGHQTIQWISRQQSFVVRKTILEKVRARAGMGGYVVTSIRDTPLATSSVFDDLGRTKYPTEDFRAFNADRILVIGRGRARSWTRGGDRPAPFEPRSFLAGQRVSLDMILSNAGADLPGGRLTWKVCDFENAFAEHGTIDVNGTLPGGRPQMLGRVVFNASQTDTAKEICLEAVLEADGKIIKNSWRLWIFPKIEHWPDGISFYDPAGSLHALDDLREAAKLINGAISDISVLLTSTLDDSVLAFLRAGGRVLLLQQGEKPLPALGVPFWREGIKIISDHPAMLPHNGYADLQFYGLATDWALDTEKLSDALPDATNFQPIMRRLDARQFTVSDYLIEMQVGAGRLIASTLRFQGGSGDQPASLKAHLAGRWLLYNLLKTLE